MKFNTANVPPQTGELARLKVLQGPDSGAVYVLTTPKASVGRGTESDVVLTDLKASRRHALFSRDLQGWSVKDLGSSNGILLNGRVVPSSRLKPADTVALGETILQFQAIEAAPAISTHVSRSSRSVGQFVGASAPAVYGSQQAALPGGLLGAMPSAAKSQGGGRQTVLLLVVAALAVSFLFEEEPSTEKKSSGGPTKAKAERKTAGFSPSTRLYSDLDPESETAKTAEAFFKAGFREYRERNYLRARLQFETVLQIDPGHMLAMLYLDNCKKEITTLVNEHIERGIKSFEAGKLQDAKAQFESVLRLLHNEPENQAHVDAKEQLEKLEEVLRRT